jgi:hypothetical protein
MRTCIQQLRTYSRRMHPSGCIRLIAGKQFILSACMHADPECLHACMLKTLTFSFICIQQLHEVSLNQSEGHPQVAVSDSTHAYELVSVASCRQ